MGERIIPEIFFNERTPRDTIFDIFKRNNQGLTRVMLENITGLSRSTIHNALQALLREGKIIIISNSRRTFVYGLNQNIFKASEINTDFPEKH